MHGIENLSFIVRAEANLGTTVYNIYDEDVQFFVRLTEGQRKKKNNTSEIVILILIFVKTEKNKQTNSRRYKFHQNPSSGSTFSADITREQGLARWLEELTGSLARAEMLLTKQQLGWRTSKGSWGTRGGGGFRNNKRVKLGIRVEVQRVKRRSRQTAVGILSTNNAPQKRISGTKTNDEDEDEGSSEDKAASQQNPSLASVPRTVRSRPSAC